MKMKFYFVLFAICLQLCLTSRIFEVGFLSMKSNSLSRFSQVSITEKSALTDVTIIKKSGQSVTTSLQIKIDSDGITSLKGEIKRKIPYERYSL